MCGRYSLASPDPARLRERFAIGDSVPVRPRYNVAPGDDVLAVTTDREGAPRGELLRWGLVPYWAEDPKKLGLKLINARSETMLTNVAFRDARRCLVVADGFYEWQPAPDGTKDPVYFQLAGGEPFAFAGLWTQKLDEASGERIDSCTIVTTTPNALVAPVHDRMPVILPAGLEDEWLDPDVSKEHALSLLRPFPAESMTSRVVSRLLNSVRNDDRSLLEPVSLAA